MRRPDPLTRRALPSRRALALGLPFLPFFAARAARQEGGESATATDSLLAVVLVRHAEKDPAADPADPGLSESGRRRAEALSRLLARAGATHLFASGLRRTKETLAPLAALSGLEVKAVAAGESPGVVARLRALPAGSVAVVAGHSNTVPAIAAALGGRIPDLKGAPGTPMLGDDEYGRLFVVAFHPATGEAGAPASLAALLELAYGE